jgi:hypothetical protein
MQNRRLSTYLVLTAALVALPTCSENGPPRPPVAVSITPSEGTGTALSFAATYSDSKGADNLTQAAVLINDEATGAGGCYVIYLMHGKSLRLVKDEGAESTELNPASATGTENSQCILNSSGFSVNRTSKELTLRASVTFKQAFGGTKEIFLYAENRQGGKTGLVHKGTWVIP